MAELPDFSDSDLWVIPGTLSERYGKEAAIELADAELRLPPTARTLTLCPAVFWSERGCNYVVVKVGDIITAKCIGVDDRGRVKMSRKASLKDKERAAGAGDAEEAEKVVKV